MSIALTDPDLRFDGEYAVGPTGEPVENDGCSE